jgi:hypothetical protein
VNAISEKGRNFDKLGTYSKGADTRAYSKRWGHHAMIVLLDYYNAPGPHQIKNNILAFVVSTNMM